MTALPPAAAEHIALVDGRLARHGVSAELRRDVAAGIEADYAAVTEAERTEAWRALTATGARLRLALKHLGSAWWR